MTTNCIRKQSTRNCERASSARWGGGRDKAWSQPRIQSRRDFFLFSFFLFFFSPTEPASNLSLPLSLSLCLVPAGPVANARHVRELARSLEGNYEHPLTGVSLHTLADRAVYQQSRATFEFTLRLSCARTRYTRASRDHRRSPPEVGCRLPRSQLPIRHQLSNWANLYLAMMIDFG